jgi:hypothetical protein
MPLIQPWPVTGEGAEAVRVGVSELLGRSRLRTGELDQARQHCQEAIKQYEALPPSHFRASAEPWAREARRTLEQIERWSKEPLVCEPREVRLLSDGPRNHGEPLRQQLVVRSLRAVPLTVTAEDARVTARVEDARITVRVAGAQDTSAQRNVFLEIAPPGLAKSFTTALTIRSPQFAGFVLRVPVQVRLAGQTADPKVIEQRQRGH